MTVSQTSSNQHARRLRCDGFRTPSRTVITVLFLLLCVSASTSSRPASASPTLGDGQHSFREHWRPPNEENSPTFQHALGQDNHLPEQDGEYSCPHCPTPPSRAGVEEEEEVRSDTAGLLDSLSALVSALDVMQNWFAIWEGVWAESIDWTAAVLGTYVASALSTISASLHHRSTPPPPPTPPTDEGKAQAWENTINRYFSQLTTFYFGQNTVALRLEAYDDMLWVVLGWLEAIKFIDFHSSSFRFSFPGSSYNSTTWYGNQFIPAYAHRARVFYDLASQGWDTSLCGGGMIWNPRLLPYKNAITNELYIAASVGMYLYFPGDDNSSPFVLPQSNKNADSDIRMPPTANISETKPHDPKYLTAALEAYKWLSASNMTNDRGLYVDGFHISNFGNGNDTNMNKKCDERNEMVYTYNQGVLLTGLRGLWESTGAQSYLDEGYSLIESAINATGWTWGVSANDGDTGGWSGLGRNGVLEDACDYWGSCSQDGQTFKGIFFHHLTLYCAPLPSKPLRAGVTFTANTRLAQLHDNHCDSYRDWIAHNARAAYVTKNSDGKFGMWWGIPAGGDIPMTYAEPELPSGSIDYRNLGVPVDSIWGGGRRIASQERNIKAPAAAVAAAAAIGPDLNDRGRGRTVETQGGGVSVLRAMREIVDDGWSEASYRLRQR
ncbi:hypothetical protein GP486_007461 [Trichoglossum hirsutum]|uniref:Glycosyl hydrolase n=1 Tax=Trichoglossum hirsutum TaxID=265104 RepID=A0A9P8L6U7_9PEZI|nr:hypothetical protein GP486_007461 [Trichoglossum hirsutum]